MRLLLLSLAFVPALLSAQAEINREPERISSHRLIYNWMAARWEAPQAGDYAGGALLAGMNAVGFGAGALILEIPLATASGLIVYQVFVTGTETTLMRFQDNLLANRPVGEVARFSRRLEATLRMLRALVVAEGTRWISGPIMDASPVTTFDGQMEILWNVAALGTMHTLIGIQRARFLSREAGRIVNFASFSVVGGLGVLDLMGIHLFDIPIASEFGVHGSNLLIWFTGAGVAWIIGKKSEQVEAAALRLGSALARLKGGCAFLMGSIPKMAGKRRAN